MQSFIVVKKSRKYFQCKFPSGCPFKLVIDSNSDSLEPGEHALDLDDLSVRTKYGTDLIFKLKLSAEEQKTAGICTLKAEYNTILVEKCKRLGGTFDRDTGAWVFSGCVADEVEKLDEVFNSEKVTVEITAIDRIFCYGNDGNFPSFLGYTLARAKDRDSGASLQHGVALIEGEVSSGGSRKNWATIVESGSVFRLQVPQQLLVLDDLNGEFEVKVL